MRIKFYHRFYDLGDLGKMPSHQVYGALDLETHDVHVSFTEDFRNKNEIVRRLTVAYKFMFPDQQYDVVYGSTPNGLELLVILRSLGLFRKPIVVWQHRPLKTSKSPFIKCLLRLYYKGFDKMLMFTPKHVEESGRSGVIIKDKLQFVKWGPDLAYYERRRILERTSANLISGKYFCSTGRENRDFPTLIKAFEDCPQADLQILTTKRHGKMNNEATLSAKNISTSNIEVSILNENLFNRQEFEAEVFNSFCMIICCKEHNYPVGLTSLYEAMALGKPVISSDNPYYPIDIEAAGIGLKVAYEDVEGWKKAIRFLAENRELAAEMGTKGRELAEREYNVEDLAASVASILKDLLRKPALKTIPIKFVEPEQNRQTY